MSLKKLVFMCKTYHNDFIYCKRLVGSFVKYNVDNIALYLVVPQQDVGLFADLKFNNVHIISMEEILELYEYAYFDLNSSKNKNIDRINAYSIRLSFWELQICENYFAIDSDMEFIRPFTISDFFSSTGNPYTVLQEYNNLKSDPFYYQRYWLGRESQYKKITEVMGIDGRDHRTVHNCQVMNSMVLSDFKKNFLQLKGWNYADATYFSIYEHFWYVAWIQSRKIFQVFPRDEFVKMVHHQGEHIYLNEMGIHKSSLSQAYLGVLVNSNWSRQYGLVDFDKPLITRYKKEGDWAKWSKFQAQPS